MQSFVAFLIAAFGSTFLDQIRCSCPVADVSLTSASLPNAVPKTVEFRNELLVDEIVGVFWIGNEGKESKMFDLDPRASNGLQTHTGHAGQDCTFAVFRRPLLG